MKVLWGMVGAITLSLWGGANAQVRQERWYQVTEAGPVCPSVVSPDAVARSMNRDLPGADYQIRSTSRGFAEILDARGIGPGTALTTDRRGCLGLTKLARDSGGADPLENGTPWLRISREGVSCRITVSPRRMAADMDMMYPNSSYRVYQEDRAVVVYPTNSGAPTVFLTQDDNYCEAATRDPSYLPQAQR